jgi:hypothetical protein
MERDADLDALVCAACASGERELAQCLACGEAPGQGALVRAEGGDGRWAHASCVFFGAQAECADLASFSRVSVKASRGAAAAVACGLCDRAGGEVLSCAHVGCDFRAHVRCAVRSLPALFVQRRVAGPAGALRPVDATIFLCARHSPPFVDVGARVEEDSERVRAAMGRSAPPPAVTADSEASPRRRGSKAVNAANAANNAGALSGEAAMGALALLDMCAADDAELTAAFTQVVAEAAPVAPAVAAEAFSAAASHPRLGPLASRVSAQAARLPAEALVALGSSQSGARGAKTLDMRCGAARCGKISAFACVCSFCGAMRKRRGASADAAVAETAAGGGASGKGDEGAIRALRYIDRIIRQKENEAEARSNAPDIIFLVRNAAVHASPPVAEAARQFVLRWIAWYERRSGDEHEAEHLDEYADVGPLKGWAELSHAKLELGLPVEGAPVVTRALALHSLDLVTRFHPEEHQLPTALYCRRCERFRLGSGGEAVCEECSSALRRVVNYEAVYEALVWTSVFNEVGVHMRGSDAACRKEDVLSLMRQIRPYRALDEIGRGVFKDQCYFVTHLLFILSRWGAFTLERALFAEELAFLAANLDTLIALDDPELVGEFAHSLRILGCDEEDALVRRAVRFLLDKQRGWGGGFVDPDEQSDEERDDSMFKKRYHAAYCGVIGLASWRFERARSLEPCFRKYFD